MAITTDWLPGQDLTGMGWWDIVQLVNAQRGPDAVAQMANTGFFDNLPSFSRGDAESLGRYVAARQAEQDSDFGEGNVLSDVGNLTGQIADATTLGLGGTALGSLFPTMFNPDVHQAAMLAGPGQLAFGGAAAGGGSAAAGGTASGAAGGTGLTAGSGGLGLSPAAAGAAGLSPSYATGALAPGYFGAETLALGGAAGAGLGSGGGAGAGASVPSAPGVGVAAPATAGGAAAGLSSLLSSPVALGMGAGALLGGLGGSQQAGTVTVEEGLPDWLKAYAKPALDKYSTDLQNYQIDPYGVMPSAMKEFQNTISGMYLDPSTNKYLEDYFKLGAERIKGSLSPSFGHMQAFGQHSGYNESLSRGLGDFATGLYGGNYAKERDRQTQLTASAPAFIGQSSQAAFQPYSQYLQTVGSLGKKKDEPYFENQFGNILGGALAGGSLGRIWG
jgi:hypothetical protein